MKIDLETRYNIGDVVSGESSRPYWGVVVSIEVKVESYGDTSRNPEPFVGYRVRASRRGEPARYRYGSDESLTLIRRARRHR